MNLINKFYLFKIFNKIKLNNNKNKIIILKNKYINKKSILNIFIKYINIYKYNKKKCKLYGLYINNIKNEIKLKIKNKFNFIKNIRKKNNFINNIFLPGIIYFNKYNLHPITIIINKIKILLYSMGFKLLNNSEIENENYNFTYLNNNKYHPSRSINDTFYINKLDINKNNLLLRTHTTSTLIRYLNYIKKFPIKIISTGKVYRLDNDKTHLPIFHQLDGFWIEENINFSNLKLFYYNFLNFFFKKSNIKLRFRPSYFPFTSPSCEVDILIKKKWIEISGAGLIHYKILSKFNINKKYKGIAFGIGIERLAMLYYNINNIKNFYKNDILYLKKFYANF